MSAVLRRMRGTWAAVADALFPASCYGCAATLFGPRRWWCDACLGELLTLTGHAYCPTCGRNAGPFEVVDRRCGRCSGDAFAHDGLVRVGPYADLLRSAIRQYKFAGQQRLDRAFGELLAAAIQRAVWHANIEAITPVPSHWTVRRKRGFFSTGAFAAAAARGIGVAYLELLVRPKRGRSQIGLAQTERKANVRGEFRLRRGACVEGRTICLVDDVTVTGATLTENVRALKKAGASAVYVAILAKADPTQGVTLDV